jgi:hypothetical protein
MGPSCSWLVRWVGTGRGVDDAIPLGEGLAVGVSLARSATQLLDTTVWGSVRLMGSAPSTNTCRTRRGGGRGCARYNRANIQGGGGDTSAFWDAHGFPPNPPDPSRRPHARANHGPTMRQFCYSNAPVLCPTPAQTQRRAEDPAQSHARGPPPHRPHTPVHGHACVPQGPGAWRPAGWAGVGAGRWRGRTPRPQCCRLLAGHAR